MRHIASLVTVFVLVAGAQVVHAQGSLTVEVSGFRGSNVTTWTFSGSYTVGDVSQLADNYSLSDVLPGQLDDNINNFTHESDELTGVLASQRRRRPSISWTCRFSPPQRRSRAACLVFTFLTESFWIRTIRSRVTTLRGMEKGPFRTARR